MRGFASYKLLFLFTASKYRNAAQWHSSKNIITTFLWQQEKLWYLPVVQLLAQPFNLKNREVKSKRYKSTNLVHADTGTTQSPRKGTKELMFWKGKVKTVLLLDCNTLSESFLVCIEVQHNMHNNIWVTTCKKRRGDVCVAKEHLLQLATNKSTKIYLSGTH